MISTLCLQSQGLVTLDATLVFQIINTLIIIGVCALFIFLIFAIIRALCPKKRNTSHEKMKIKDF